jgi:hypothetical protein
MLAAIRRRDNVLFSAGFSTRGRAEAAAAKDSELPAPPGGAMIA